MPAVSRHRPGKPLSGSRAGSAAVSLRRSQTRTELEERWRRKRIARRIRQALAAVVVLAGVAAVSVLWLTAEDEYVSIGGYAIDLVGVGRTAAPEGLFVDVSVSEAQSCAVRVSGELVCWGGPATVGAGGYYPGEAWKPPTGPFARVALSPQGGCALRRVGTVACWRYREYGRPDLLPFEGPFLGELVDMRAVTGSGVLGCGVRADAKLVCWGDDVWFRRDMPEGRFVRLVGRDGAGQWCALDVAGQVACWGGWDDLAGRSVPEGLGPFADVEMRSGDYGCGIGLDGATVCWHSETLRQVEPTKLLEGRPSTLLWPHPSGGALPAEGLTRFADGGTACAFDAQGQLRGHCAYQPYAAHHQQTYGGFAGPPSGRFAKVSLSGSHGCGIRPDQTVACWGHDSSAEGPFYG